MLEIQLGHSARVEIGVENSKRVEFGNVVSSNLVSSNEKLDLKNGSNLSAAIIPLITRHWS